MKCKRRNKKKKESPRTTNFLQSRKRFKKNHKNLDTILLRKRNLQSNFWNVFHPKKPFQLSESLFHRKHPWKISPRSPLSQNFHKTPCEEDFFHNRANKILLESLSLSFSLQISTRHRSFFSPIRNDIIEREKIWEGISPLLRYRSDGGKLITLRHRGDNDEEINIRELVARCNPGGWKWPEAELKFQLVPRGYAGTTDAEY